MLVSHSKRFIFLANPKTGSESVRRILKAHSEVHPAPEWLSDEDRLASGLHNHITAHDLMATFAQRGWNWSLYHSFTMIRNPWDRIVSAYEYGRQRSNTINHRKVMEAGSFEAFVERDPIRSIECHAFDLEGRQLVVEILRLEDLSTQLPQLLEKLGLGPVEIPHVNRTARRPYQDYYNETTREIVRQKYALDISIGNYRF